VRIEERVFLLLLDTPEFAVSFFGAVKIGAVPVPVNPLLKPADYTYLLNNSRARVAIVSQSLLSFVQAIPKHRLRYLETIIVVGAGPLAGVVPFEELTQKSSSALDPEPTSKDDAAFWLYSSGSTGQPKACVHLQHDMGKFPTDWGAFMPLVANSFCDEQYRHDAADFFEGRSTKYMGGPGICPRHWKASISAWLIRKRSSRV
jgi:acyl-coenzyme A synthetase/AMP-(fatty) acid ligase